MALASAVYLSLLGKNGLMQVGELCYHKAHYAADKISHIPGFSVNQAVPFFNEFVVTCPEPVEEINKHLLEHGFLGGYALENEYPTMNNQMLIAVTEMNLKDEIDALAEILGEVNHG